MDTVGRWHIEHKNFERLLEFLERQLDILRGGRSPQYKLMLDVVSHLRHFSDRYHCERESVAFGYLVQGDPGTRAKAEGLLEEHRVIAEKSDELCALLSPAELGGLIDWARVEAALDPYVARYRRHIAEEEQDILPRAAEILTAAQWESVANAAPPGPHIYHGHRHDPTFGTEAETRYRKLLREISADRPTPSSERPLEVIGTPGKQDPGRKVTGPALAVPRRRHLLRPSAKSARRLLARQASMFLALILAYLQYYFLDVNLQIELMPALVVYILG